MYRVEISSSFDEYWRYNVVVMLEGLNSDAEREYVVGTEDSIAEIGDNLLAAPMDYPKTRVTVAYGAAAAAIESVIYVIPHTMPQGSIIAENPPFMVKVKIFNDKGMIHQSEHAINQWSGSDITIKI
ncbi:MAG: hypothetical protein SNH88_04940 [Rikenellaceae bacterium]